MVNDKKIKVKAISPSGIQCSYTLQISKVKSQKKMYEAHITTFPSQRLGTRLVGFETGNEISWI